VQTLSELFSGGSVREFLMAWNRRIPQSAQFFDLMGDAGEIPLCSERCAVCAP
jgi:hypothetical protein